MEENTELTREELVSICEDSIVPMDKWHDRDSAMSHEQIGRAWALLKAGAPFDILRKPEYKGDGCVTDDQTIWIVIEWRGFSSFELGNKDREVFYIPTRERLEKAKAKDRDWY